MKSRLIGLLVFLWALSPVWALASPSKITEVAVYPDRAQVTRTGHVNVQKGDIVVRFEGLPAFLDENSVQVWGTGAAEATLEGVSVELQPAPKAPEDKVSDLENRIQLLRDRKKLLDDKRKAVDAKIYMLMSLRPEDPKPDAKTLGTFADVEQIVNTLVNGLKSAYTERRAIDGELKQLAKQLAALEKELRKIISPSKNRTKNLLVNLSVTKPGAMEISFSYILGGATWKPLYDIRALPNDGEIEITGYAEIVQRTGEDWNDVSLSVSTAKPNVGGTPPKVSPIYLVFYVPPPPARRYRGSAEAPPPPPASVADAMPTTGAGAPSPEPAEEEADAEIESAQVKSAGTAVFFEVKQKKSIPSDGEPHRVSLAVDKIKAEFGYAAWPEGNPMAFLRAKVTNSTGHPFPAGAANVFVESSFIGNTQIADWAQTEEKTLSLGIDQGVRIERKLLKKDTKESGNKINISYEYKIEIKNFKPKAVKLELFDRIPTSRQGDIEIKKARTDPEPAKQEDNGILSWQLNLNPGATTEVLFSYTVRYPKERRVVGLP